MSMLFEEGVTMTIALVIVAALLAYAAIGSAISKFRRNANVVAMLEALGVRNQRVTQLAVLEVAGGLGLILGIWSMPLGLCAAVGLALYFLGALVFHFRHGHKPKDYAAALVIFLIAIATVILELHR
jgi:uncharacterized membrane protein YphA (DoxX/SURF4 family)